MVVGSEWGSADSKSWRSTRQDRSWALHSAKRFLLAQSFKSCPTKSRKGRGGIMWDHHAEGFSRGSMIREAEKE